jgi:hypothetical protein
MLVMSLMGGQIAHLQLCLLGLSRNHLLASSEPSHCLLPFAASQARLLSLGVADPDIRPDLNFLKVWHRIKLFLS